MKEGKTGMNKLIEKIFKIRKRENISFDEMTNMEEIIKQETTDIGGNRIKLKEGYNQETWDKGEKLLELVRNYYQPKRKYLAEKIFYRYNGKNEYNLYVEEIKKNERKIDEFERKCDLYMVCAAGCSACCNQLIGINPIEKAVLKKAIYKLNLGDRERIKLRAEEIISILEKEKFNIKHKTISDGDYTEKELNQYLKLKVRCPLLNEANKCMIYEARPVACWSYRNYGQKKDCVDSIAIHACSFDDAGLPILDSFGTINRDKTDLNDFEILPVFLREIL